MRYDYYRGPRELRAGVFAPASAAVSTSPLGITPEQALRPLPAGTTPAGAGPFPRGLLARPRATPLSGLGDRVSPVTVAVVGALAYYLWKKA